MEAIIKGEFLDSGSFKRKDGSTTYYVKLLCGSDAVQVQNAVAPDKVTRLQPLQFHVDIRNSQYGLIVTAVN